MRRFYHPNRPARSDLSAAIELRETFTDRAAERQQAVPWRWPRSMREVGKCEAVMYASDKWQKGRGRNWLEDYKHRAEGAQWVLVRDGFCRDAETNRELPLVGPVIDLHPMPHSFAVLADVLGVQVQFYDCKEDGDPEEDYFLPKDDQRLYEIAVSRAKLGAGRFPDDGQTFLMIYTTAGVEMLIVGEQLAIEKDGIVG